jgi:dihydrodipicolinate synthase/N-acetylneuraminate lyase
MSSSAKVWAKGPSVPLTTPFRADESIDHEALAKQVVRLAKAKVGIVLLGTNGEGEPLDV